MTLLDTIAESRHIQLNQISDDPATQPREKLDDATVERYADAMAAGQQLPPITVYHDGETYWLADGWHRREAARRLMRASIEAEVRRGTRRDAILFAAGANETHGLPRSNEDKRRAVMMLLRDAEWSQWSDREIARRTQTSQPFVSALRRELSDNGYQMPEERLFRRGGETYTQNVNTEARTASARAREAAAPGAGEIEAARQLVARALTTWTRPVNFGSIYNQVQRLDGGAHTSRRAVRVAIDRMIEARNVIELKDQYGRRVYALADDPAIRQKTPANATPAADLKQRILDLIDVSPLPAPVLCHRLGLGDKRAEVDAALAELKRENRAHEYRSMWFVTRDINDIPRAPASKPAPEEQPVPASMTPEEVKRAILEALAAGPCDLIAKRQTGWLEGVHPAKFSDYTAELIEVGAIRRLGMTGALIGTYELVPDTAAQSQAWLDQQVSRGAPDNEQPTPTAKDAERIRELLKKHAPMPLRMTYIREQLNMTEERFTRARMLLYAENKITQGGESLWLPKAPVQEPETASGDEPPVNGQAVEAPGGDEQWLYKLFEAFIERADALRNALLNERIAVQQATSDLLMSRAEESLDILLGFVSLTGARQDGLVKLLEDILGRWREAEDD